MFPGITVIIPAAGASGRMGRPKQFLPWGKTTLIDHAVTEALHSGAGAVVVVSGAYAPELEKAIGDRPVTIVKNAQWKNGLGTSIACGVKALLSGGSDASAVLIMLADQPSVGHLYLNRLMQCFQNHGNTIVATSYGKRAGTPAVFGRAYFNALCGLTGDRGARDLLAEHRAEVVVLDPGKPIADIDTLEDYDALSGGISG